ncbi:Putative Holin-X, holin superfamily III [Raineyella antarctica]|uniref:Putative Holin-X, holin superfamily III n=1 Tax=Raineyella antarctica TaxID=1577474 RepID=A0A1G6GFF8_9ACTN|nr:phage holin family protein [Raineyella antarctica]SDB80752.1 Putative Holin-X, holin superfamily III [Raineyella antarctica]
MAEPISDLLKNITDDVKTIVRDEIDLAKAEMMPKAKNLGIGGGMFAAAGVFGVLALTHLMTAAGFGLAVAYSRGEYSAGPAWGFLTIGGVFLILAALLALVGFGRIRKATRNGMAPTQAIDEASTTVQATKAAVARGKAQADTEAIARKAEKSGEVWVGADKL